MRQSAVVLGGLLGVLAVTAGHVASADAAGATCTANPPGVAVPEHDGRSLELHLDGWDCVLGAGGTEVAAVHLGWWPTDPIAVWAQLEAPADHTPSPAATATPSPSPTLPSDDVSETPQPASGPPSLPLLEALDAPRLVVEHADGVWVQIGSGPWQRLGDAEDVRVVGEGRWWFECSDTAPTFRSVADPDVMCVAPDGFFDVERRTAVIHEDGLTSVYVAEEGGMHFAGGTLVVTDLDGGELHRVDLGGTSQLSGLTDGFAIVERVQMPEFATTHHVVVDIATGMVVDEAATSVSVRFIGS